MKKSLALIIVFAVLCLLGFLAYEKFISSKITPPPTQTQTPPSDTANWKVFSDTQYGFGLKYPADFFDVNQQPRLLAGDCNYQVFPTTCPNINNIVADDLIAQGGDATIIKSNLSTQDYWDTPGGERQTINTTPYCLYSTGDAGAGHAFNYYYFTTVKDKKCLVVYLATSTTNCDNYLPLEQGNTDQATNYNNCIATNKNQPILLNKIISTFTLTK